MKELVFSDLHADARTAGFARYPDASVACEQVVRRAVDTGAGTVVFAGDLGDPDSTSLIRCIGLAIDMARELQAQGIESWWMAGNHDVLEDGFGTTVLDPIRGVDLATVVTRPLFDQGRLFLPYTSTAYDYSPEQVVREYAGAPVEKVYSHLMLEGIAPGSETEDFPRGRDVFCPIDMIREQWPGVIHVSGHYHGACTYRRVHVVGALMRLSRGEISNEPQFLEIGR